MSSSYTLTLVFAGFLTLNLLLKLWLANRQLSHIAQHRASVPAAFEEVIALSDHQKAADYTSAKLRLGHWRLAIDSSMLLAWTLLGGLGALDTWLMELVSSDMLQQLLLQASC